MGGVPGLIRALRCPIALSSVWFGATLVRRLWGWCWCGLMFCVESAQWQDAGSRGVPLQDQYLREPKGDTSRCVFAW